MQAMRCNIGLAWAPTATDREICDFARASGCVLLTNNLDFPQILAHTHEASPSVVLLRGQPLVPEARGGAVLLALRNWQADLLSGSILSLDWSGRTRSRLLPL